MSTKTDLPVPTEEPVKVWFEIRGVKYCFTELEIGEYDKLVKMATSEKVDDNGNSYEETDSGLLMRLMVPKVMTPPPPKALLSTGTRFYRAIAKIINELHYGDEPVKALGPDGEDLPEPKDDGKGND